MELLIAYSNQNILTRLRQVLSGQGRDSPPARATRSVRQDQHRLCPDEVSDLVRAYNDGATIKELQTQFGVSRSAVMCHLKRNGVDNRYRVLSDEQISEAAMLYDAGLSLAAVARQFDVSPKTISNTLKRAGLSTRAVGTNRWSASF